MAKKKKTDDGLNNFEIQYSDSFGSHTANQRAIDKHDAILKFKQLNPGVRVKDAKEIPKPPVSKGLSASTIIVDEVDPSIMITGKKPFHTQIKIGEESAE